MRNYVSYFAVEDYVYIGLRRIVRHFRSKLGLPRMRAVEGVNVSHLVSFWGVPHRTILHQGPYKVPDQLLQPFAPPWLRRVSVPQQPPCCLDCCCDRSHL